MFRRLPHNNFVPLVRTSFFRVLGRTLTPQLAIPFLMKEALKWMPVITGISPCGKSITIFSGQKYVGKFSIPEGLFPPRNSVVENWTVANPYLFPLDSRLLSGSCFIPHLSPPEHDLFVVPLYAISTVVFPLPLDLLALGCSSARGGLSKLPFTRREMFLANFLFHVSESPDTPF